MQEAGIKAIEETNNGKQEWISVVKGAKFPRRPRLWD